MEAALQRAQAAARSSIEHDLTRPHLPEIEDRYTELVTLGEPDTAPAPAYGTWLLVLSHLAPDEQRELQTTYEELQRGAEVALEDGGQHTSDAEAVVRALLPVEGLLAELPHTTLERPVGPDDHDLRRRTLSIEVVWRTPDGGLPDDSELRVFWRDRYDTEVANMTLAVYSGDACWILEITDPAPGRSVSLVVVRGSSSASLLARTGLDRALAWANEELGDQYVIASARHQNGPASS